MSAPQLCSAAWIIGVFAALFGAAKAAEPPPALLADAADQELDDIDRAARSGGTPPRVLRCWQEGRLIVERPVRAVPPESVRAIPLGGTGREVLQLYDLRNSTCLIE